MEEYGVRALAFWDGREYGWMGGWDGVQVCSHRSGGERPSLPLLPWLPARLGAKGGGERIGKYSGPLDLEEPSTGIGITFTARQDGRRESSRELGLGEQSGLYDARCTIPYTLDLFLPRYRVRGGASMLEETREKHGKERWDKEITIHLQQNPPSSSLLQ